MADRKVVRIGQQPTELLCLKHSGSKALTYNQTMFRRHGHIIPMLALATAGCLWGTGFFFGKIALTEMPVASMVLFRFAFACAGLLPVIFFDRPHFARSKWGWVFAASVLGVPLQYLVQFKGLSLTTVSHASLMVGTLPMLLAIAAVVFAGERLHFGGWLALAGSTCGAALIALSSKKASGGAHASMRGDLLIVLSMLAAVGWILISKRLMRQHSAVMVTAFVFWIGTFLLAVMVMSTSGVPALHYSRMDFRGRAGILRYREHNSVVELGAQAGSGISGRNFREFGTAGRRDPRCFLATRDFGDYGSRRRCDDYRRSSVFQLQT